MKNRKKIILEVLLSIGILFSLLIENNYAVEGTQQGNNQQSQATQKTQTTTKNTSAKSNNANLSDLGITPHDFKGFKPATTSYTVEVPEETETVNVYAKAQHSKATVSGTGIKKLEKGENKVEVVVTAEDGTKKTYTITITRISSNETQETSDTDEKTGNIEAGNGLTELKINDLALTPEFKTDIYEYTVKYIGQDTKLNIEANPTSANYTVEITGNENLQEGENIITILVYESNGTNVATYQITVNKSLVDEEALAKEAIAKQKKQREIIIAIVVGVVIVAIIAGIIIKKIRDKKLQKEYDDAHFYNYEDEDEYEDEYEDDEELPKAFKKSSYDDYDIDEEDEEDEEESSVRKHNNKGKRFK